MKHQGVGSDGFREAYSDQKPAVSVTYPLPMRRRNYFVLIVWFFWRCGLDLGSRSQGIQEDSWGYVFREICGNCLADFWGFSQVDLTRPGIRAIMDRKRESN